MKHIGIASVTVPGGLLCIDTIVEASYNHFGKSTLKHPRITFTNPDLSETNPSIHSKNWAQVAKDLLMSIDILYKAGVDFVIIPSNAPHFAIKEVQDKSKVPVWSIIDITVEECKRRGFKKTGILGVGVTMYDGLYVEPLEKEGIEPVNLSRQRQEMLHKLIFSEIIESKPTQETAIKMREFIQELKDMGADSFIAGCTEIPVVITSENESPLPFVDTTRLLATKAFEFAIK